MKETIDKKNVIWNMIGATANAFTSLIFMILVTRINGIDEAGIFTYGFATACIFYIIAIYAGRTFQVTDNTKKYSDTDYIYHRSITCIIMIITIIIFNLIKGYDIWKSSILVLLCLYKGIEAFSEAWYAILQKKEYLYKVGISLTLKSITSMIVLFIINIITKNLLLSCIGIVGTNLFFTIFYDYKNIKQVNIIKTPFNIKKIKGIFLSGFFTFFITFLGVYVINAPRYAIDDLCENELQTIFGIIIMPATFMGLMGQYLIQPVLTKVMKCIEQKDIKNLKKLIRFLILAILGIGLFVLLVAYLLEAPVLGFIYGVNLRPYLTSMMIIIFGSILYSLGIIISYLLIAFRKTFVQAIIYSIVALLETAVSYILVERISLLGASLSYTITMMCIAVSFLIYLFYIIKKVSLNKNIPSS